jgi:hypothetical protein
MFFESDQDIWTPPDIVGISKMQKCGLLAQNVDFCQRFPDLGSKPPQTGHTFSVGLIIRLTLHLEHLTEWSLARSISAGSRLVIMFLRFRKVLFWWSETGK